MTDRLLESRDEGIPMKRRALAHPEVYRRGLLESFTTCARRTRFALMVDDDLPTGWVEDRGQLGQAFHLFMEKYLRTLGKQGYPQMPTQEAIEVMYEALGELPFVLPWRTLDELRQFLVLRFCEYKWVPRLLASAEYETELRAEIVCPDGQFRTVSGRPDVLMFDPPRGLLIPDAKTGKGEPKGPREPVEPGTVLEERKYLSDLFQGDCYGYLALMRYPAAQYAIFKEFHLRSGQIRQIRVTRDDLEHIERKLGVLMMRLDEAITAGPKSELWAPRPGGHCARQCPVARSCPIPREMRGAGAITTVAQAEDAARAYAVLEGQRAATRSPLEAWWKDPDNPLPMVNEREFVGWNKPGRGRRWGVWKLEEREETAA